jgi:hypothetical protein
MWIERGGPALSFETKHKNWFCCIQFLWSFESHAFVWFGGVTATLVSILGPKKGLPHWLLPDQCWALLLLGYQYDMEFSPSVQHSNVDGFSRSPRTCLEAKDDTQVATTAFNLHQETRYRYLVSRYVKPRPRTPCWVSRFCQWPVEYWWGFLAPPSK